jgi:hypothetical protein
MANPPLPIADSMLNIRELFCADLVLAGPALFPASPGNHGRHGREKRRGLSTEVWRTQSPFRASRLENLRYGPTC